LEPFDRAHDDGAHYFAFFYYAAGVGIFYGANTADARRVSC
jgi:hypothetical protein